MRDAHYYCLKEAERFSELAAGDEEERIARIEREVMYATRHLK